MNFRNNAIRGAVLMMAAKSASNVAEMAPAGGGKVKAPVSGTAGGALAVVYIRDAERKANEEVKASTTMKQRLEALLPLTREDHLAFRAALEERVDMIRDTAKGMGMSLAEYKEFDPKSNSIHATISLWQKFSSVIETGWTPNLDDSWTAITQAATAARNSVGASGAPGTTTNPQTGSPVARSSQKGRKAATNYEKAVAMLEQFPISDLEMVAAWVQKRLANVAKPGSKIGKIVKDHVDQKTAGGSMPIPTPDQIKAASKAKGGGVKKQEAANAGQERAVAKDGKGRAK